MKHLEVSTKNIEDQEEEVQRQTLALVKLLKTSEDPHIEASSFLRILKYRATKRRALAQVNPSCI